MAAGLGLHLYDQMNEKSSYHSVVVDWLENTFLKKYCIFDEKNPKLLKMALYHDCNLQQSVMYEGMTLKVFACMAFVNAWYLLPQNATLAVRLYNATVHLLNLRNAKASVPLWLTTPYAFYGILPLLLAIEFDDNIVATKLRPVVERREEGKFFHNGDEYGWFYYYMEKWPRGQFSALRACIEIHQPGDWQRAYHLSGNRSRFQEPSVCDLNFPTIGLSQGYNDRQHGILHLKTYCGIRKIQGTKTSFRIVNLPDANNVKMLKDSKEFTDFVKCDDTTILIKCTADAHYFEIDTGYVPSNVADNYIPVTFRSA